MLASASSTSISGVRLIRSITQITFIWVSLLCVPSALGEKLEFVDDLALGVALFHYYQQNDFDALSELMVAEEQEKLSNQQAFAEQLQSGIYLNYGMDSEARTRITSSSISDTANKNNENAARLNYYLGQLLYTKGNYEAAYQSLQKVDNHLSNALKPELAYLMEGSLISEHKIDLENDDVDNKISLPSRKKMMSWGDYISYNQTILRLKREYGESYNFDQAIAELESLIKSLSQQSSRKSADSNTTLNNEDLALTNKALLTTAYLYLMKGEPTKSIKAIQAYSADGIDKEEAMFTYGWANFLQEDYNEAAKAWEFLAKGDVSEAATREALFSLGYLYEKQGHQLKAIQAFEQTAEAFRQESTLIESLNATLSDDGLTPLWTALSPAGQSWLSTEVVIDKDTLLGSEQLISRLESLAGSNQIALLMNQKRDIGWLKNKVEDWSESLESLKQSTDNQQYRFEQVFNQGDLERLQDQLGKQTKVHSDLQNKVNTLEQNNIVSLMNDKEISQYKKVDAISSSLVSMRQKLEYINALNSSNTSLLNLTDRLARQEKEINAIKGYIEWSVKEQSSSRQWKLKKSLNATGRSLEENSLVLKDVESLVPEQQTQNSSLEKIDSLQRKLQAIELNVNELDALCDEDLLALSKRELGKQQTILRAQLAQVQHARASLMDQQFMQAEEPQERILSNDSEVTAQ